MWFRYSIKFYSEKFNKIIAARAFGKKKKIILSIYIFDVKLQASYCFILWQAGIFPVAFVMNHKLPFQQFAIGLNVPIFLDASESENSIS